MSDTWLEGKIDFEGQKLAENLSHRLISLTTVVSFLYGYWVRSVSTMLLLYVAGYVLTLLVCAPAWPIYNKHPLVWLDAIEDKKSDKESSHDETDEEEKR